MPPRRASGAKCDQERELAKPGVLQALVVEEASEQELGLR
jgi:hypothetical protein